MLLGKIKYFKQYIMISFITIKIVAFEVYSEIYLSVQLSIVLSALLPII